MQFWLQSGQVISPAPTLSHEVWNKLAAFMPAAEGKGLNAQGLSSHTDTDKFPHEMINNDAE
jgi:hypothetical protein